jgi:uncharacterized RDD family membrane protein YckC
MAYLVDAFLLSLVGGAFPFLVITGNSEQIVNGQRVTTGAGGSILVSLIYFVLFWSRWGGGRTLGMRLLKLRVIREAGMTRLRRHSSFTIGLRLILCL